jgi:hypothetical protein
VIEAWVPVNSNVTMKRSVRFGGVGLEPGRPVQVADAKIVLRENETSAVRGQLSVSGTDTMAAATCTGRPGSSPTPPNRTDRFMVTFELTGTQASITGGESRTETGAVADAPSSIRTSTSEVRFAGSVAGDTITGTVTYNERSTVTGGEGGVVNEQAAGTFSLTLRRSP